MAQHTEACGTNANGHARDFRALVASGQDKPLPIYLMDGTARMLPVSELLGEPHKDAQRLLLRACHEAEAGNAVMAVSLLKAFTQEMASQYGVSTAEALELIADPDDEEALPAYRRAA
jgi:hypothetical protein